MQEEIRRMINDRRREELERGEDIENQLPPYPDNVSQRIMNEEINEDMPTELVFTSEDSESQTGYLFIYYYYNRNGDPDIEFTGLPNTWQQWATTFADFSNPILWETQVVGDLKDRELVETLIRQQMEHLKDEGIVRDYRIRRNYISGYN